MGREGTGTPEHAQISCSPNKYAVHARFAILRAFPTSWKKMGYGSRAIELLTRYYEGVLFSGTAGGGEGSEASSQESSEEEEEEEEGEEKDGVNGATDGEP